MKKLIFSFIVLFNISLAQAQELICTDYMFKPVYITFNNYYPFPIKLSVSKKSLIGNVGSLHNQVVPARIDAVTPGILATPTNAYDYVCVIGTWIFNDKPMLTVEFKDISETIHLGSFLLEGVLYPYGTIWCSGTSVLNNTNTKLKLNYDTKTNCYETPTGVHMAVNIGSVEDVNQLPSVNFTIQNQLAFPLTLTALSPELNNTDPHRGNYFPAPQAVIPAHGTITANYFSPLTFHTPRYNFTYKLGDFDYKCTINYQMTDTGKCLANAIMTDNNGVVDNTPFTCKVANAASCKLQISFAAKAPKSYQITFINDTDKENKSGEYLHLLTSYEDFARGGKYVRTLPPEIKPGHEGVMKYNFGRAGIKKTGPLKFTNPETNPLYACRTGILDEGAPCVAYGVDDKTNCVYSFQYDEEKGQCVLAPHAINNVPDAIIECPPYEVTKSNPVIDPDDPDSFICAATVKIEETDKKTLSMFYLQVENNSSHDFIANDYSVDGVYNVNENHPPNLDAKKINNLTYTARTLASDNVINYQFDYGPSAACKLNYGWANGGCYASAQSNSQMLKCSAAAHRDRNTGACQVRLKIE